MANLTSGITLGILGGGQLGRMSALAAARLGIRVITFCPESDSPASHVSEKTIQAEYSDKSALKEFSGLCDYISYEFENIPIETIDYLDSLKKDSVRPGKALLEVSQDRIKEKSFLNSLNIETAKWFEINNIDEYSSVINRENINRYIIKTSRFGYDGKGQVKYDGNIDEFFKSHENQQLILESFVDFKCEVSVIVSRDINGRTVTYGPMLNEHKNQILSKTTAPAPDLTPDQHENAILMACKIADAVGLVGVLTVEMFVHQDGRILANEIAPRTHNSGHWSIDACAVSQFEQHVRAICGLPVVEPGQHSNAVMLNLIGDDVKISNDYMGKPNTCVHLYGKTEIKAGRKLGHITLLSPLIR